MLNLLLVSLLWAFSFGLIKRYLVGLDSSTVAFARLLLAAVVFVPWVRRGAWRGALGVRLAGIGAVQFGLMYVFYILSFQSLAAHEVALFTITTPLLVSLVDDLAERRWRPRYLVPAGLAVAGAAVIVYRQVNTPAWLWGFVLVQLSNLCFAAGQVFYRRAMAGPQAVGLRDQDVFGVLYVGAVVAAAVPAVAVTAAAGVPHVTLQQALVLLYMGVLASGVGFFLWNVGARRVNTGALAVFNNLKIPLAVAASLLVFGEKADLARLLAGGGIMLAAVLLNQWWAGRGSRGAA